MTTKERETLIEAVTSAYRSRDAITGELRGHAAWHDLDAAGRVEAYAKTIAMRELEAALDPEQLSTTARLVLARIQR